MHTSTAIYNIIHQLGFIRAVSCCAQNAESHWSHVDITLSAELFSFQVFYKEVRVTTYRTISCLVQVA